MTNPEVSEVTKNIIMLFKQLKALGERVAVIEECTSTWDGRFDDLEQWQDKVDDRIDEL